MSIDRENRPGSDESTKRSGYRPLTEGYTPKDEENVLPEPPQGGSGENGKTEEKDD
jgi:hypothetical protein